MPRLSKEGEDTMSLLCIFRHKDRLLTEKQVRMVLDNDFVSQAVRVNTNSSMDVYIRALKINGGKICMRCGRVMIRRNNVWTDRYDDKDYRNYLIPIKSFNEE